MPQPRKRHACVGILRTHWKEASVVFAIWCLYAYLSFIQSPEALTGRYGIGASSTLLIRMSVALPLLGIWLAGLCGFASFLDYADLIKKSWEGKAFRSIGYGLLVLLASSMLTSLASAVWQHYAKDVPGLLPSYTILRNYLTIALSLLAYWFVYSGSRELLVAGSAKRLETAVIAPFILFSVFYAILVLQSPYRTVSDNPLIVPTYFLSDALIVTTVILPYVITWLYGLLAVLNIWLFGQGVKGKLYRDALRPFIIGFTIVILLSVFLQVIKLFSGFFSTLGLGTLLVIVYVLVAVIAAGNLLIADGAKRLKEFEAV